MSLGIPSFRASPAAVKFVESLVLDFEKQVVEDASHNPPRGQAKIELRSAKGTSVTCYKFPQNALQIAQIFTVAQSIIESSCISRQIRGTYYAGQNLFKDADVARDILNRFAVTSGLDRQEFGVLTPGKGIIAGSGIAFTSESGVLQRMSDEELRLIPIQRQVVNITITDDVRFFLVAEKETIASMLLQLRITNHSLLRGRGVLISSKGLPDGETCGLLNKLEKLFPSVPILVMVDCNPWGIKIASCIRGGLAVLPHMKEDLAAPSMRWIGPYPSELKSIGIDLTNLSRLEAGDATLAWNLLRDPSVPSAWKEEIKHMVIQDRKADLDVIPNTLHRATGHHYLLLYVAWKLDLILGVEHTERSWSFTQD